LALLDTSLPGVRQLQNWIRAKTAIRIQINDGTKLDGTLDWQDMEFLALRQSDEKDPILIQRLSVSLIRSLN
jgi:host factor-I protein